ISGEEEADYIFRAVRSTVDLQGSTAVCVDIGGGSAELIVGTADEIFFTTSEPLGSLRLSQRFALTDRPAPEAVEACRGHALVRHEILRALRVDPLLACPVAIREGIVESRVAALGAGKRPGRGSLRRHSVNSMAERTDCDMRHGRHVARLAARIFEQAKTLH